LIFIDVHLFSYFNWVHFVVYVWIDY
jgi:hypothetical protein